MYVRDAMTTDVLTVLPSTPLKQVARLLVEHRISGVPVVSTARELLGVVSEADFVAKEAGERPARRSSLRRLVGDLRDSPRPESHVHATTAGEAMTAPAVTISADRPLREAAALMAGSSINRLPVLENGRLVGIVTRADIVRAYARSDAELDDIVRATVRAVDGLQVVGVRNGIVVLSGTVAHAALVPTIRVLIEQIDGIIGVDDKAVAWPEPRPTAN